MPAEITIPISVFELTVKYDKLNILLMTERARAVQELFAAFAPWNPQLDDMEVLTAGKPTEQGVQIKIAARDVFSFSAPRIASSSKIRRFGRRQTRSWQF